MSIFSRAKAIESLRRDRLASAMANFLEEKPSDDYLWSLVLAAERDMERAIGVWLTPREVLPDSADQAEEDALTNAGAVVEREPGYDYDPSLFRGNTWGLIELRQKPIIAVHGLRFIYPGVSSSTFDVPLDWLRIDRKYGRLNIVPASSAVALPLDAFRLSVLGGGRSVPLMIQVRYSAGLQDACSKHPDLTNLVLQSAALNLVEQQFLPQSGSVSADGLSQSISLDASKYRDAVEAKVKRLKDSIGGIKLMVM